MQQFLAQDLAAGPDGFGPCRVGIGQFLALPVPAELGAFSDVKIIPGHGSGIAGLFQITTHQARARSGPLFGRLAGSVPVPL